LPVALAYTTHTASFSQLGVYPSCCPEFTGGSAFGSAVGAYLAQTFGNGLRFHARLTYASEGAPQSYDERTYVADLRDSATVVPALFRHTLTSSIFTLGVEPLIGINLGNLELVGGMRVALPLTAQFAQREEIVEPAGYGEYVGDDRTWVETDADIPNVPSLRFGIIAGMRYNLPLNAASSVVLSPEVIYHHDLSGVSTGVTWTASQVRVGFSLGFRPTSAAPKLGPKPDSIIAVATPPVIDSVPPAPVRPLLMASIKPRSTTQRHCSSRCQFCSTINRNKKDATTFEETKEFIEKLYFDQADYNKKYFSNYNEQYKKLTGSDIKLRGLILSGGGQANLWPHFEQLVDCLSTLDIDI
jgi:hypothetical protein